MLRRFMIVATAAPLVLALTIAGTGASGATKVTPQLVASSSLHATSITLGGAVPLATDRTVAHFAATTLNPVNGVTYSYNMVGANPATCSGPSCATTIQTDIVPVNVNIGGWTFSGSDVVAPTLASPIFATNDYAATPTATATGLFPAYPNETPGPGGALLPAESGVPLQLEDATMRAQFNQSGASPYHLVLHANVRSAVTINVPLNQGIVVETYSGVVLPIINASWWSSQINNLLSQADPTHLPLYLTNNVVLSAGPLGHGFNNCCIIGYHGAKARSSSGAGNAKVQTYAWSSWVSPGMFSDPSDSSWALQDIHALGHEIAEWADDPFINNTVQPWVTPTAPQYGCTALLETGDPVVGIGFSMGTNAFEQGVNLDGHQYADGTYHPEDEVLLPWFMRSSPSTASDGRYTLMGTLNPFPGFQVPATGC